MIRDGDLPNQIEKNGLVWFLVNDKVWPKVTKDVTML